MNARQNWELLLIEYAVSIAGLVDIIKIAKGEYVASIAGLIDINRKEYVASIAGLIDINKIADNKTHWGDSRANLTGTSCSLMRTGRLTGNIDNKGRKLLLYLSWLLGWKKT